MPGSRVSFLVCVLCVSILSGPGFAAEGVPPPASAAPRGLTPPPENTEQVVAPDASALEEVIPDQVGRPQGPRVTVSGLAPIDPSGAGLIGPGSGGFAPTLWTGSPRAAIATRIGQLPASPNSPAMQSLLRRVLLSGANPPSGVTPDDEPSMLAQRLLKLVAGGRVSEAAMLGAQSARDDALARQAWTEALLLQARDEDACGDATTLRQSLGEPYWLKLRAFCYVVEGNSSAAVLTLDVMRERAIQDDAFFELAGALTEGSVAKVAGVPAPSGIHMALLARAKVSAPAVLASWLPGHLLFAQSADAGVRLVAVERASVAGLVGAEQLRDAYEAEVFTADQYDDPEEWSSKLPASRVNALYFQAISKRTRPAARAAAFAAALERADSQNRFALFAQMSRGISKQILPIAETTWLAPQITRVLLYNGDAKAASVWLSTLLSPTDVATVNALQMQAGLVYPSTENLARMPAAMTWLGQNALKPSGAKDWLMARATREIPLLEALGYAIPPDAQWAVSGSSVGVVPSGASAEALAGLARSAQQHRLGETVLNALVALGVGGPARAQGQTVVRVVEALVVVSLRDEARALASEAVLSAPVRPGK